MKDHVKGWAEPGGSSGQNLVYWGGPVIKSAKSVAIFWGPSWADSNGNFNATASEPFGFFAQFRTSGECKVITQYSGNQQTNLTNTFWWDSSAPPSNVTDTAVSRRALRLSQDPRGSE